MIDRKPKSLYISNQGGVKTTLNIKQDILNKFELGWNPGLCWFGAILGLCVIAILPGLQFPLGLTDMGYISFLLFVVMWIGTENNNGLGGMASLAIGIALGMIMLAIILSPLISARSMLETNFSALALAFICAAGIYYASNHIKNWKENNLYLKGNSS